MIRVLVTSSRASAAVVAVALALLVAASAPAAQFAVNTTQAADGTCDTTSCALGDAITAANGNQNAAEQDTIVFDFPASNGQVVTIPLSAAAPAITESVKIDGRSHPGPAGAWPIVLDGTGTQGSGTTDALRIESAGPVVISGLAIGNFTGVSTQSAAIVVSGDAQGAGGGHVIEDVAIGFAADGATAQPNTTLNGIVTESVAGTTIRDSVIGNNTLDGVSIQPLSNDVTIENDRIGVAAGALTPAPNGDAGVGVRGGVDGGPVQRTTIRDNIISANGGSGVWTSGDFEQTTDLERNAIWANAPGALGIDQDHDGAVAPIDDDLISDGRGQNQPVLTSGVGDVVTGELTSAAGGDYRIELFASAACNASGHGDGEEFLGTTTATTDGAGHTSFTFTLPHPVGARPVIAATATRTAPTPGGTSEFSGCITAQDAGGSAPGAGGGGGTGGNPPAGGGGTSATAGAGAANAPAPEAGKTVVAGAVSGAVVVTLPDGTRVTLGAGREIPFDSRVDVRKGTVRIVAADGHGGVYDAIFFGGVFVISQHVVATAAAKATAKTKTIIIELRLVEDVGLATCPAPAPQRAHESASNKRRRHLWGNGKGKFQVTGRHSSATVRGTIWLVQDSCAGTLTKVRRGVVDVRDFTRSRTVKVAAGHQYLARPPRHR